jgi:SET domain-containing protein
MKDKKLPKLGSEEHKELKWKESIEALNDMVCTEIRPSKIHGVGIFALRDIKKGEKMYQIGIPNTFDVPYSWFKKMKPYVKDTILQFFPFKTMEDKKEPINFWYPVNSMQAYINHSDKPNYDPMEDKALKNIKEGDEITEDYTKIEGYDKVYKFLKK